MLFSAEALRSCRVVVNGLKYDRPTPVERAAVLSLVQQRVRAVASADRRVLPPLTLPLAVTRVLTGVDLP